ncbi:Na-translocating system protein MpsC family protein [Bacillus sp. FJAT-27251]|uniref:Na-translocating system protein MpsC family protein n=1 Tax=Bacillus sp. FJAT-27251 TaxID=1684142 RepID=UPI0006A78BD3|nr:Na-translocating system protein MpsC family protein [Bacillus sp. FJAT-27251]
MNLRSGMFLMVLSTSLQNDDAPSTYRNKEKVHLEIIKVSEEAQKTPQKTESILLNKRMLMIVRSGILISIEKELIELGFDETLIIAKRSLEKRLLEEHLKIFEAYLQADIIDFFVDWDFKKDISFTLFIMNPGGNGT